MFEEIGWGNAMRYILTGDEINAEEAYRLGLVQAITEPGNNSTKPLNLPLKFPNRSFGSTGCA
jgi:enoyl-CoA hydratase/carnithine racemase